MYIILTKFLPGSQQGGLNIRTDSEWILKAGEEYLFKVTSLDNTNKVGFLLEWYEPEV